MKPLFYLLSSLIVLTPSAAIDSSAQALNGANFNLVSQAPGGPLLYYNGTGNVPAYNLTSPDPVPITPTSR